MKCPNCNKIALMIESIDGKPEGDFIDVTFKCPDCKKRYFGRIIRGDLMELE